MWQPWGLIISCFLLQEIPSSRGWGWTCLQGQCLRGDDPSEDNPYSSLEVCRVICNKLGALWPAPSGYLTTSHKVLSFDPSHVAFDFSGVTDIGQEPVRDLVTAMTQLFLDNLRKMCEGDCVTIPDSSVSVFLKTSSGDLSLNWQTDESYAIELTNRDSRLVARIQAVSVYGARHGLETLSQLVAAHGGQLMMVTNALISDKPSYVHRGIVLDTSRHYLPPAALRRTMDGMAACKLNTLHWHVSDSHSFPLVLPRVPNLAKFGAYSAAEVYTPADVQALISYGRVRGVRVLVELDMPAHAGVGWQQWGGSLAVCVNAQPWQRSCLQPPCGQLNPSNSQLYNVLRDVFRDLIEMLPPGETIHMGGDEVYIPCWNQTQEIKEWMTSRGMNLTEADFLEVWGEFHRNTLQVWDEEVGHNKSPVILWTSHLTSPDIIAKQLDKDRFVIEAWTDSLDTLPARLLDMGYKVIIATRDAWYLDHGFWGPTRYYKWRQVYDNALPPGRGVLGGEVAMWGELVDDSNLDTRVWPRAAAAAERLWTNPDTGSSNAEYRLLAQRRRLITRGLQPEAVTPEWCEQNQGGCDGSSNNT